MHDVERYLQALPEDRREAIQQVRDVINAHLPPGYEEKVQYGMISWCVPESVLPAKNVYNKQQLAYVSLSSQKNYMALYLMSVYGDNKEHAWFEDAFAKAGKNLDMGKACIRFKTVDALPLDVIGEAVSHVPMDRFVKSYRRVRAATKTDKAKAGNGKAAKAGNGKAAKAGNGKAAKAASRTKPTNGKPAQAAKASKQATSAKPAKPAAAKKQPAKKSR